MDRRWREAGQPEHHENAAHMILAVDVHYAADRAVAAGVLFSDWADAAPVQEAVSHIRDVAPYRPGAFYLRELPCLLALLREHALAPQLIVIDGFVFLSGEVESETHDSDRQSSGAPADADHAMRPGLGKHLYDALDGRVPVIGVAKTAFAGMPADCAVSRGDSARPLFVTAVGVASAQARAWIQQMHGSHRIPTLLKRVDRLCRETADAHVDVQESGTR